VLQDLLPDQALLYLIRAPYDLLSVSISASGKVIAVLLPESHTVVALAPGRQFIHTYVAPISVIPEEAAPTVELNLQRNERYFLVLSDRSDRPGRTEQLTGEMLSGAALTALTGIWFIGGLPLPTSIAPGSRQWKPYTEPDARPMLAITKLELPER
jgi:hypothetical protein